jgi:hypothetical protein
MIACCKAAGGRRQGSVKYQSTKTTKHSIETGESSEDLYLRA